MIRLVDWMPETVCLFGWLVGWCFVVVVVVVIFVLFFERVS